MLAVVRQYVASTKSLNKCKAFKQVNWISFIGQRSMPCKPILNYRLSYLRHFQHFRGKPGFLYCLLALVVHRIIFKHKVRVGTASEKGSFSFTKFQNAKAQKRMPGQKESPYVQGEMNIIWESFARLKR